MATLLRNLNVAANASTAISASHALNSNNSVSALNSLTASYTTTAITASYAVSAGTATTATTALTASYIIGGGSNGSNGTSGTSGAGGASGAAGTSGTSGVSGAAGADGSSGTSGVSGTAGTSGASGAAGADGSSGTSGASGAAGSSGTSGASGAAGSSGTSGASGAAGSSGTSGSAGTSGTTGASGSSGTSGSAGTSGISGANGSSGTSGTAGSSGNSVSVTTSDTAPINPSTGSLWWDTTTGDLKVYYFNVTGSWVAASSAVSGTAGTSGSSGTSGTTGTSGSSGTAGSAGTAGSSGTSGASFVTGSTYNVTSSWANSASYFSGVSNGTTNYVAKFTGANTIGTGSIFDSGSKVGIGTSSPTAPLHISTSPSSYILVESTAASLSGSAYHILKSNSGNGAGNYYRAILGQDAAGTYDWGIGNFSTAKDVLAFYSGGVTERMRIDASGNVGIGTNSPSAKLDIGSTASAGTLSGLIFSGLNSTSTKADYVKMFGVVEFNVAAAEGAGYKIQILQQGAYKDSIVASGITNNSTNYLALSTTNEAVRITSTGNVGIGTSSPASKLQVTTSGAAALPPTSGTTPSTGELIRLRTSSDTAGGIGTIGLSTNQMWLQACDATNLGAYYQLLLNPNGGNVGIGTASPNCRLQVASSGVMSSGGYNGQSSTLQIAYTGTASAINSDGPSLVFSQQYDSADPLSYVRTGAIYGYKGEANGNFGGGLKFRTQPTGASAMADVMTLDKNGNVGIGTTSPAQRLHVQSGTATVTPITTTSVTGDTAYQAILVTKFDNDSTTSQNFIQFQINNGGANCGKITANGANTAAFGSTSDRRVKENIADLPSQLANIMALRPVEFDYVESYGGGHQIGFVAQEMQQVYPDVIAEDSSEEKILSITGWSKTEARLVKAIQELKADNDSLRARIAALESK